MIHHPLITSLKKLNQPYPSVCNSRQEKDQPCLVCWDPLVPNPCLYLRNCGHIYHFSCLQTHVFTEISNNKAVKIYCPDASCKKMISESNVQDLLEGNITYQKLLDENRSKHYYAMNRQNFLDCPTVNCGEVFRVSPDKLKYFCKKCKKEICNSCKTEWHYGLTCNEFKEYRKSQSDEVFINFANQQNWKSCPQCSIRIERISGCNHMACTQCKTPFCYACGKRRDGTCRCG